MQQQQDKPTVTLDEGWRCKTNRQSRFNGSNILYFPRDRRVVVHWVYICLVFIQLPDQQAVINQQNLV